MNPRRTLLELFDAALRAVDGRSCVKKALHDVAPARVEVFAIGKAAGAMTRGAHAALGERIARTLVITKDGHVDPELSRLPNLIVLESAHSVPDERSLAAGAELTRRLSCGEQGVTPLFLVSGGSSSLVESLRAGLTLDDLRAFNEQGLSSGANICELNAGRACLSTLKGGGVARLLAGRAAMALFISDVPGDDPDTIGSGLLGHDGGRDDAVQRIVVANNDAAIRATLDAAAARGLRIDSRSDRFDGDVETVAREFVEALRATPADGIVWGGESTVRLPPRHGRGGRNGHLALLAASLLGSDEPLTILAAGTDGTDGLTVDAGAIIDAGTILRAELGGCDVARALREFDSVVALDAAEDLIHTGPTGTNVGDLLIGIRTRRARARPVT